MRIRVVPGKEEARRDQTNVLAAMIAAGEPAIEADQPHYIGMDDRRIELHVIAAPDNSRSAHPGDVTVIHAMPTRHMQGDEEP